MATTQLSPTATPGRRYSFSAKESAGVAVGICSVTFTAKNPAIGYVSKQPDMTFASKKPKITFEG